MFWTIGQFPELNHLEPAQRAQVLGRLPWWTYPWVVIRALGGGFMLGYVIGVAALLLTDRDVLPAVGGATGLAVAVMLYRCQLKILHDEMRAVIAGEFAGQRPPFCFGCGYDLRSSSFPRCPECGVAIEGA